MEGSQFLMKNLGFVVEIRYILGRMEVIFNKSAVPPLEWRNRGKVSRLGAICDGHGPG